MKEPFIEIGADYFSILPFSIVSPEGYTLPKSETGEELPNCCRYHQDFYNKLTDWFAKFPNCCPRHQEMARKPNFSLSHYTGLVEKIVQQVSYTEYTVQEKLDAEDWFEDITDYIEYSLSSFGHPNVGAEWYLAATANYVDHSTFTIPRHKKQMLREYFDTKKISEETKGAAQPSLNVLYETYQKWVKAFPFRLEFFKDLRKHFENRLPIMEGKVHVNRYSKLASGKVLTPSKLIESLIQTTKELLQKVNSEELIQNGIIHDLDKYHLDLVNETHRVKQDSLLNEYTNTEARYVTILRKWLQNEKEYFKELAASIERKPNAAPTQKERSKSDIFLENLQKCDFSTLPKLKVLTDGQLRAFVELTHKKSIPYQLAMLEFVGFIPYLRSAYRSNSVKLHKALAKILDTHERTIKGNLNTLNEYSEENRQRYTAHRYKDQVAIDYENIK